MNVPYFRHFPVVLWVLSAPLPVYWVFLSFLTLPVPSLTARCYTSRTPAEWRPVRTAGSESSRPVWQPRWWRQNMKLIIKLQNRSTEKGSSPRHNARSKNCAGSESDAKLLCRRKRNVTFFSNVGICYKLVYRDFAVEIKNCWACCTSCVHVRCFSCDIASSISRLRMASSESATYRKKYSILEPFQAGLTWRTLLDSFPDRSDPWR